VAKVTAEVRMTSLTGRYTGSFESHVEQDLHQFTLAKSGDHLITLLSGITDTALTEDFWKYKPYQRGYISILLRECTQSKEYA